MSGLAFIVPGPEHAALTLGWRTAPRVTRYMFTDVHHGIPEQETWLRGCLERPDYRHWLILHGSRPIGLVNLQRIDWAGRRSQSGFYLGEKDALRLGGFVLPYLFNHAFLDLGFETMVAEVMEDNVELLRYNRALGYRDDQPARTRIEKNGEIHTVHRLCLTRQDWLGQQRFQRFLATFPWPWP